MSTKKSKKNEEKPKTTPKGILAFYSSASKSKPESDESPSPDAVQNIDEISPSNNRELSIENTDPIVNLILQTPIAPPQSLEPLPNEVQITSNPDSKPISNKLFPMFQKKTKEVLVVHPEENSINSDMGEKTLSAGSEDFSDGLVLLENLSKKTSSDQEDHCDISANKDIVECAINKTDLRNDAPHDDGQEKENVVEVMDVEVITPSEEIIDLSANSTHEIVSNLVDEPTLVPSSLSVEEASEPMNESFVQIVDDAETPQEANPPPKEEEEQDSGRRRSARIRVKQNEITKRMEEQRKYLESSDDESGKLIKRGSRSKQQREKASDDTQQDETDAPITKKKKVASIFISKEEKARLAQEEKERKARELEQERLLKLQQEAEERERRIQEQMKLTKMRNDAMLGANRTEFANPFFAARQVQKVVSLLGDTVDSSNEPAEQETLDCSSFSPNIDDITQFLSMVNNNTPLPVQNRSRSDVEVLIDYFSDDKLKFDTRRCFDSSVVDSNTLRALWTSYITENDVTPVIELGNSVIDLLDTPGPPSSQQCALFGTEKAALINWLENWKIRRNNNNNGGHSSKRQRRVNPNKRKSQHNFDEDEEFSLADTISDVDSEPEDDLVIHEAGNPVDLFNVYFLLGQHGTGKTSLVYECAKAAGASIIEINTTQARNAATLKRLITEASQSYQLTGLNSMCEGNKGQNNIDLTTDGNEEAKVRSGFSIILIDEVDIVFEEEDAGFHSSINKLVNSSKIPIILTAERVPDSLKNISAHYCELKRPELSLAAKILKNACDMKISSSSIPLKELSLISFADLRAAQNILNLFPFKDRIVHFHGKKSFESWLGPKLFDFAMFDHLQVRSSPKLVENKQVLANSSTMFFRPEIHSVFPHLAVMGKEITISGQHFLQQKCGSYPQAQPSSESDMISDSNDGTTTEDIATVCVFIDGIKQTVQSFTDSEIKFTPSEDLRVGFHQVSVEMEFQATTSTTLRLSSERMNDTNDNWFFLFRNELTLCELSKVMSYKTRTFAGIKSTEKLFPQINQSANSSGKKRKKSKGLRRNNVSSSDTLNNSGVSEEAAMEAEEEDDNVDMEVSNEQIEEDNQVNEGNEEMNDPKESTLEDAKDLAPSSTLSDDEFSSTEADENEDTVKRRRIVSDEESPEPEQKTGETETETEQAAEPEKMEEVQTTEESNKESPEVEQEKEITLTTDANCSRLEQMEQLKQANQTRFELMKSDKLKTSRPLMQVVSPSSSSSADLDDYSKLLDHFSSSDLLAARVLSFDLFDENHHFEERENLVTSLSMRREYLESINCAYRRSLYQFAHNEEMISFQPKQQTPIKLPEHPAQESSKENEGLTNVEEDLEEKESNRPDQEDNQFLRLFYAKEHWCEKFSFEFELFQEMPFSSLSLSSHPSKQFFGEFLPFFHLIGKESVVFEEKEREYYRLLYENERKSSRGRRLQSNQTMNTSSVTSSQKSGPKYVYLKRICERFEEKSLKELLQLYSGLSET